MTKHFYSSKPIKTFAFLAAVLICFLSESALAQNTKGDKPANTQKSIFRLPKLKSKKKGGDRPYTGGISGRKRIRTKDKSSAAHAVQTRNLPNVSSRPSGDRFVPSKTTKPFANRRPSGDRPYRQPGGQSVKIRSSTAKAARNNIYPDNSRYVNNPAPRPHDNQKSYSNRRTLTRVSGMATKRTTFPRKKILVGRTASRSFVTRGRKNVYWGKFRKGEHAITTDIAGRTLRTQNFHTPGLGVIPSGETYKNRKKKPGDRPYNGTFISGHVPSRTRQEKAWSGSVSGHSIRYKAPHVSQKAGKMFEPRRLSISGKRGPIGRMLPGNGNASRSTSGRISGPIERRAPGLGANAFERFLGKFKGRKPIHGGGSIRRGFNNNGRPIEGKAPGGGALAPGRYQGFLKGGEKTLSESGYGFTGNIKSQRPIKGGGSISGRRLFNGRPIQGKGPGIGSRGLDTYRGNILGIKSFNSDGYSYSGNLKASRPLRGGGSINRNLWNNSGRAIQGKGPGIGGRGLDTYRGNILGIKSFSSDGYGYSGNLKASRPLRGGGSVSRNLWNNSGRPVQGKGPGIGGRGLDTYRGNILGIKSFGTEGYSYSGNLKASRPLKGGGSVSRNLWNNSGRPVQGKGPGIGGRGLDTYRGNIQGIKAFGTEGYSYSGDLKATRPLKGGGSVSGKLWNNKETPIEGKTFSPAAMRIGTYSGNLKASRPLKGGGSVSGKLWNNKEQAIEGKTFLPSSMGVSKYAGREKQRKYVRNPNSKEEALKKLNPDKSTYAVGGLQIKTKPHQYDRNKLSAEGALKGESAGKNSLRAIEYSNRIQVLWKKTFEKGNQFAGRIPMRKYVHNPNSKKEALMVLAPGKVIARMKDYQGNIKMSKPHGNNLHPDAQFAHSLRDNVKQERTFLMNIRLKWAKLFKKNDTQPAAVKQKLHPPRYDKKEKELWKDLYD